jgi:hypothetical protein
MAYGALLTHSCLGMDASHSSHHGEIERKVHHGYMDCSRDDMDCSRDDMDCSRDDRVMLSGAA